MSQCEPRIGYVAKMYPRFSETFVVNEIRGREAQGEQLEIFSLRLPADGRFHESLAGVRAPVTYLRHGSVRGVDLWQSLRDAQETFGDLGPQLPGLLAVDPQEAVQALELAILVRRRGLEHLHAHFASAATTVTRTAAAIAGVPYSFTAHAKDIFHDSVDAEDLERKLSDAHHVVTVSDYNLAHLRSRFPTACGRLVRVYNGLDLDRFRWSSGPREPGVVAVGRLVEKKGFAVLVEAVALLRRAGREVPCTIVGAGELATVLAEQVDRLGLRDLVTLAGPLPQSAVQSVVARTQVLAAPCVVGSDGNADGLPTVLLEALAVGTACVSTSVTGIPEVVRDGETGLLVPPGDPVALAACIARLLDDPALRARLAGAGRQLVESAFDGRHQARALRSLVESGPLVPAGTAQSTAAEVVA
jgi:glycosyltransferase involved in cell wall biosynthesis